MTSGNRMPPVSGLMADALSASAFFVFKDFKVLKVLKAGRLLPTRATLIDAKPSKSRFLLFSVLPTP